MPKFKLNVIRIEDPKGTSETSASETIYSHEQQDEAAARKLIHDITKPVRVYRPRAPKSAKTP